MTQKSVEDRVSLLENELRGLPERIGALDTRVGSLESQCVQFRVEVRAEFSATREELGKKVDELGAEMHALHGVAMAEMRMLHEHLVEQIKTIKHG